MTAPIVTIEKLSFAYNGHTVLQEVDLQVRPGDFMAVIGPNGGGKTTLLKLILGLLKPDGGRIAVMGARPRKMSHRIGYLPQNGHSGSQFPVSVMDTVLMGRLHPKRRWPWPGREDRRAAIEVLERMEVAGLRRRRMADLSGGQRQRVLIARALVAEPVLLLLDEPTAGVDPQGQSALYRILEQLNAEVTIMMVSHDLIAVSRYIKSVACVNRRLHFHDQAEVTADMVATMYPCAEDEICPVELVAHGLPHRVLQRHGNEHD